MLLLGRRFVHLGYHLWLLVLLGCIGDGRQGELGVRVWAGFVLQLLWDWTGDTAADAVHNPNKPLQTNERMSRRAIRRRQLLNNLQSTAKSRDRRRPNLRGAFALDDDAD